jgi:isochorismate hydrolase
MIRNTSLLNDVAKELNIPILITEQYPKAFGHTVPEIKITWNETTTTPVIEKKLFSMLTDETNELFKSFDKKQVILCGIESHVCVMQTALDLIDNGYQVHLVCDAVSSQKPYDRTVALNKMKDAGVVMTTLESAIFDLLKGSAHPNFKAVSTMIKNHNEFENEFGNDTNL